MLSGSDTGKDSGYTLVTLSMLVNSCLLVAFCLRKMYKAKLENKFLEATIPSRLHANISFPVL